MRRFSSLFLLALAFAMPAFAADEPRVAEAKKFFEQYQAYDGKPEQLNFFADNAQVLTVIVFPGGQKQEINLSGAQFRQLGTMVIEQAKQQGKELKASYANMTFTPEENFVRIQGQTYSPDYNVWAPFMVRVSKDEQGNQRIRQLYSKVTLTAEQLQQMQQAHPLPGQGQGSAQSQPAPATR